MLVGIAGGMNAEPLGTVVVVGLGLNGKLLASLLFHRPMVSVIFSVVLLVSLHTILGSLRVGVRMFCSGRSLFYLLKLLEVRFSFLSYCIWF